jgi:hypothetical protein
MVVVRVLRPIGGVPHARLRAVSDPSQSALVSCHELCDPSAYCPVD